MEGRKVQHEVSVDSLAAFAALALLSVDSKGWQVEEKLAAYYKAASEAPGRMFEFRSQLMSYELMNDEVFTEVLCPARIRPGVPLEIDSPSAPKPELIKGSQWDRSGR